MSSKISGMPAATAGNLTGVAKLEATDKNGATVAPTYAQLRTALFGGGTGFTATDPLVAGSLTLGVTAYRSSVSASVTNSATTIFGLSSSSVFGRATVIGDSGSAGFCDEIVCVSGVTPAVVSSTTIYGSPVARTYSATGTTIKLAMASGTYTVKPMIVETV